MKIDGALDARLANTMLSVSGRHAAGSLAIALQLRGTMAKPQAQGTVRLTGGEFRDDQTGFKLTGDDRDIRRERRARFGSIASQGQRRTPVRSAANGEVRLDPAAGFPGSIRLTGQHAQIVANDIVSATADMALERLRPAFAEAQSRRTHHDCRDGYLRAQSLQQRRLPHSRHETSQSDPDGAGAARADGQGQRPRRARAAVRCDARR